MAETAREARRLVIAAGQLDSIRRHAEEAFPEECCGILIGERAPGERPVAVRVSRVVPAENRLERRRRDRYSIAPADLLAAHRRAREERLEVVGYYHSHPEHGARPSRFDRRTAWPEVSYLIVAVSGGRAGECRSWRLGAGGGAFEEEEIAAVGEDER